MQNKYSTSVTMKENFSLTFIIQNIKPESTVLEFGPATGYMTEYLKNKMNCKVYIVEIDSDAYNNAIQYAVDGVLCNAETLEWKEKFQDVKFDYITFADVLEHLADPWKVLSEARELLKPESGKVLTSIPNIAHNAVLVDLFNDKFVYRKTGIMDNTHLRFFTKDSMVEMFDKCGLGVEKEDAVFFNMEYVGFGNSKSDVPENVWSELRLRDSGFINQYLFILSPSATNPTKLTNKGKMYEGALYYSLNDDYDETHKIIGTICLTGNRFKAKYSFPTPVMMSKVMIELLPFSGKVTDLKIDCSAKIKSINAVDAFEQDEVAYFYSDRIKYEVSFDSTDLLESIEVNGSVGSTQISDYNRLIKGLIKTNIHTFDELQKEIGSLNHSLNEKTELITDLGNEINRLNIAYNEKMSVIDALNKELLQKIDLVNDLSDEVNRLNVTVAEKQNTND